VYSITLILVITGKIFRYKELQDLCPSEIDTEDAKVKQERERIKN
jgi:hypothetical protein